MKAKRQETKKIKQLADLYFQIGRIAAKAEMLGGGSRG